jgi:ferredoxin-NADP reductase
MQPIIDQVQSAVGGRFSLVLGSVLIGALTLQALSMLLGTWRRIYLEREQRHLSRQRMQLLVKSAAAQLQQIEHSQSLWNGYRKFKVARKVRECDHVYSFYLAPNDGKALPRFKPGQYLTFQLTIPGSSKPVIRCYSLSDSPNHQDYYRVTIKKVLPPPDQPQALPGLVSSFFCDRIAEGDILDVKAPAGHFALDVEHEQPVVFIAGGVGVTPMLSMVNTVAESGSKREVWFFYGVRNRSEYIQMDHLMKLIAKHDNIRLHVCVSDPTETGAAEDPNLHKERVSADLLKRLLPSNNYDFFICGPPGMMKNITDGLKEWGVPKENILFEAFGPASLKAPVPKTEAPQPMPEMEVEFSRTGKRCRWKSEFTSLLDLAEANGVQIESGCRAGNCGTCLVAIKSGKVEYLVQQGATPEDNSCLTCIAKPKETLVLDA